MIKLNNLKSYNTCLSIWKYCVVSEEFYHTDLGKYRTYGMRVIGPNYMTVISDVSTYRETVIHMVAIFNQYQLSPIHLRDVIEDMLP